MDDDAILDELECGHCGSLEDVVRVDFDGKIRHLCKLCRDAILAWI